MPSKRPGNSEQDETNVSARKVLANKQERLIQIFHQGIGKTVAEVELGWVTAPASKPTIRCSSDFRLVFCDRFDDDVKRLDQFIKRGSVVSAGKSIDDDCDLEKVGRGNAVCWRV